ncbi:hypothetical protein FN846DRAFT_31135 [Sphaerosporella brunnea]|uniref:Secreted protein n=1 Tax=Sphaerosporella brunnea TaxID=1250544 RepID=A0A5J5EUE8_9PEZI|nr:hypothetical protein FN846DRAFT_31135 [Sphaerosporella brunnea]
MLLSLDLLLLRSAGFQSPVWHLLHPSPAAPTSPCVFFFLLFGWRQRVNSGFDSVHVCAAAFVGKLTESPVRCRMATPVFCVHIPTTLGGTHLVLLIGFDIPRTAHQSRGWLRCSLRIIIAAIRVNDDNRSSVVPRDWFCMSMMHTYIACGPRNV